MHLHSVVAALTEPINTPSFAACEAAAEAAIALVAQEAAVSISADVAEHIVDELRRREVPSAPAVEAITRALWIAYTVP